MAPRLVLFCGIPGSGKSTIAGVVCSRVPRSILIQTDRIRSMLSTPGYSSAESEFVYGGLVVLAEQALLAGYETFIEGTFPREEYRADALKVLSPLASRSLVVYVDCEPETAYARNTGRREVVPWQSFLRIYTRFEVPEGGLRVDTSRLSPQEAAGRVLSAISEPTAR